MLTGNRAVITGLGVVAANGAGVNAFWESLLAGRSGVREVSLFDASDMPCRIAGEVRDFQLQRYADVAPKRMSRASQFAVAATAMALADAGLGAGDIHEVAGVPVVMGVSTSAMDLIAAPPKPWTAVAAVPHAVASAVAYSFGFEARLTTISDGCASGLDAVFLAAEEIRRGKADVAIAGAADSAVCRYVFECFCKSRRLSTRNDDPHLASRPFDRDRDGGIIAEGSGAMVVENLDQALGRGATPYAEVISFGACADPPKGGEGSGLLGAMSRALDNGFCRREQIDHISAHGPSDPEMDRTEMSMIRDLFGPHAYRLPVTSIKGATGNPMAVGGMHQAIAAALSLKHGVVPPVANLENQDLECDLDCVQGAPRKLPMERAMVNTHGFGRGNSALILARVDSNP